MATPVLYVRNYSKRGIAVKKYGFLIIFLGIMMLPVQTLAEELPGDGQYYIEVILSGGSGRAQVESPAQLTVADGVAMAVIKWSSPYYEYMLIDETYYYPVNSSGNSIFEIPVLIDVDMAISAQTIAMSEPHQIDYILHFNSATLKPLADGRGALAFLGIAVAVMVVLILVTVTVRKCRAKNWKN